MRKMAYIGIVALFALAMFGATLLLGYLNYSNNNMDNEKDVLVHMGLTIVEEQVVPEGQTVKFYIHPIESRPSDFNTFLQFIEMYRPDVIRFMEKKLNFVSNYEGCALYFVRDDIIYLYR